MSELTPIILDVDTGTDDALALAYAIASPQIELVAVTTVAGNVDVETATANTLAVLDWLGASTVPVHRGASKPLARPLVNAAYFHDEGGLGGARLPASQRSIAADRGPAAIIRLSRERPGQLTLVAVGPLTNVAIALNVEPRLTEFLKAVVVMGGAFTVPGNVIDAAEFNIHVDPEAADQVFSAPFAQLTAVGLDVTNQVALAKEDWFAANERDDLPISASLLAEVGRFAFRTLGVERFELHDPLAVAVAIRPDLLRIEHAAVEVKRNDSERGRTQMVGPGTVQVAVSVKRERALEDFRLTVGLPTPEKRES
ncbi:MAG: nucleoside hydrolase [Chloroflexia bacterium]|nr:nucleoside hydrolase [Chloroflexia bacterium]